MVVDNYCKTDQHTNASCNFQVRQWSVTRFGIRGPVHWQTAGNRLDDCYDGIAQKVLISTAGDIYTEDYDLEEMTLLPGISEDVEMSITP